MRGLFCNMRRGRVERDGRKYQYLLPARSVPVRRINKMLRWCEEGWMVMVPANQRFRQGSWRAFHRFQSWRRGEMAEPDISL